MSAASWAAGGMLAVNDPQNPAELMPLVRSQRELYPSYLEIVESSPACTCHYVLVAPCRRQDPGSRRPSTWRRPRKSRILRRGSIPPVTTLYGWRREASIRMICAQLYRQLCAPAGGNLMEATEVLKVSSADGAIAVETGGRNISAGMFVNCCGAWAGGETWGGVPVEPVKGHMANLRCSPDRLRCVVRTPGVYLVPRGDGRVTVGATLEQWV